MDAGLHTRKRNKNPGHLRIPQVRVESTITESNGSSSMASVCGGCLAMLDAGASLLHTCDGRMDSQTIALHLLSGCAL